MLPRLAWLVMLTGCGLMMWSDSAEAQKDKKDERTQEQKDKDFLNEQMNRLARAYELVAEGRDKNAPEYLITAAGMMQQVAGVQALNKPPKLDIQPEITEGNKDAVVEDKSPLTLLDQSAELFKEASDMGAAQGVNVDPLIKLARSRKPNETRSVVGGPKKVCATIGPGATAKYTYTLRTNDYSQWFFNSKATLTVAVRRADNNQPFYWGKTTYASRVWHPNWHPNPKVKQAPITIMVQNYSKKKVHFEFMLQ